MKTFCKLTMQSPAASYVPLPRFLLQDEALRQAQTKLHRSRQSATRIFRELEYSGLIVRRKQGLGKPALITLNYPADAKLIAKEGEDAQA